MFGLSACTFLCPTWRSLYTRVMILFALSVLLELGFSKENIITSLEMRMKRGIGKCGRCNAGEKCV